MEEILITNLIKLRKMRGFRSREDFAEAAGLPFPTYRDIESGKSWPRPETLAALARALDIQPYKLFIDPNESSTMTHEEAIRMIIEIIKKFDHKPE